ncbi:MAG: cation diffusion facilitator family transporter [Gammaproteobacteria bacterium]
MLHDHDLDAQHGDRRVGAAIVANLLLTVAQIIGGILAGSLALIADALHNFSDVASLAIAFSARKIARWPADSSMTFGYKRVEIVAALINYTTLIVIGLYLLYQSGMRFIAPPEVEGWIVVILGGIALTVDTLTALLTWSMQKGSVNIRALFLHNLSDALASVAVIAAGSLILLYGLHWVDPLITALIAAYILYLAFTEIGGVIRILMLGSPPEIDLDEVMQAVVSVEGVSCIHHTHFWQMREHESSFDTHVILEKNRWCDLEEIKATIKTRLRSEFGIRHSTLEFEQSIVEHWDSS